MTEFFQLSAAERLEALNTAANMLAGAQQGAAPHKAGQHLIYGRSTA